ncbi:MAG: GGDEF domain-containing protein [Alphaproteobacteria bacterium]
MSLRLQTAMALAAAILAVSLAVGAMVTHLAAERLETDIGDGLAELAFQMADKLDRDMWARSSEVRTLTVIDDLRTPGDPERARKLIDALQEAIPTFSWIGVLSSDGTVLVASDGILEGVNIAQRPVFQEGIQDRFIGDVHDAVLLASLLPNPTGEPMKFVDIAYPLRDADGVPTGVLATHLSWAWAKDVRRSLLQNAAQRSEVAIYIVAKDNTVLLADDATEIGTHLDLTAIRAARETGGNGWTLEVWPDGETYVTGYAAANGHQDFEGFGWTVLTRQSTAAAFAPIDSLARQVAVWGIGLALGAAALGWLGIGLLTRPLAEIAATAERIRQGSATEIPHFRGPREIAALSDALNRLIDGLRHTETALDSMSMAALHDQLTGLPNRMALESYFETAVPRAKRERKQVALLYIDLDDFKPVNDTLGHAAGDLVLKGVAGRLTEIRRGGEIAARLGGDEFVMAVLVDDDAARSEAGVIADRIVRAMLVPFDADGRTVSIGCSVGVGFLPADAQTVTELFERADSALYAAKEAGKSGYAFAEDVHSRGKFMPSNKSLSSAS